ncbi:MAG: hypothetical protein COB76_00820 [Alphaproteobacteria bacterium]|nr:MAG: hypothetical protein COB76_00820 [Alphaproteobacteria bacterium]
MSKKTISIIGAGEFGRFIVQYLTPEFDVSILDPYQDLSDIECTPLSSIVGVAQADFILLAVPVKAMDAVCADLKPHIKSGQTIIELASVKMIPRDILKRSFGGMDGVNLLGVHALFGPTSGKNGIEGLNVTVSDIVGDKFDAVYGFLEKLNLNITVCTAEEHDQQMAYVQGLTHLLAKTFNEMDIPEIFLTTKTYDLLDQMWKTIRDDSDDLFDLIQSQNPYVSDVREKFLKITHEIDNRYRD